MSDDAKKILDELRSLAARYRATEIDPKRVHGGPAGGHDDGFVRGQPIYSVGVVLDGIVQSLERKYG